MAHQISEALLVDAAVFVLEHADEITRIAELLWRHSYVRVAAAPEQQLPALEAATITGKTGEKE